MRFYKRCVTEWSLSSGATMTGWVCSVADAFVVVADSRVVVFVAIGKGRVVVTVIVMRQFQIVPVVTNRRGSR